MNPGKPCKPLGLLFSAVLIAGAVWAADHRDTDILKRETHATEAPLDINDVYVFRSPANSSNAVIAFTVSPLLTSSLPAFSNDGRYELYIDNNNDRRADVTIRTTFSGQNPQRFKMEGLGSAIEGDVTAFGQNAVVVRSGDIQAFAGPRDDPFFFDLDGFNDFLSAPCTPVSGLRCAGRAVAPPARNFFAARNTAVIAVELPVTRLTGGSSPNQGTVNIWGKTFLRTAE